MASHEATSKVPTAMPISEEVIAKLAFLDAFPTIYLEDIISNVASVQIPSKSEPADHSRTETANSFMDDLLDGVVLGGAKTESIDLDNLTCTRNSSTQTDTAEVCLLQTCIRKPSCETCQWTTPTHLETSTLEGFTPSSVATPSDKFSRRELHQDVTRAAEESRIRQCRRYQLSSSTPEIADGVGESEEQTPNCQSQSNSRSLDGTTSGQLLTPWESAIFQKLGPGSTGERNDKHPVPSGTTLSSQEEETSVTRLLRFRGTTGERVGPPCHEVEDESESRNSSLRGESSRLLCSTETPRGRSGNGSPEKSVSTMSTRASLSGTSENVEPETAVNHDVSGCEVGRPREKSTLSDTSQNEEENGPSKRHCLARRVTVIRPVVRVARLPDNLVASICGLQNRGVQSNVRNNASREGIAAVGIEYEDCERIEQCSEESMDWDAQLISERESTDTEAEGEGERSASTKICAYDTSSEDSDLECETPVLTIDLEATCSDSVSLSPNKETSERDGTSENIGENLSPPCLPRRKRGEENDADAAANVSPSKETRRIGQNTNTEPVTEESPEGRRFTERSHDQERGNGRQVVDASVRRRRKPVPFSQLEEEAIFFGFSKYWQDSMTWKKIHVKGGFVGRTTSDLRDKYRNLQRNSFAYNSVKKRVSKKREQKINPLKELQKHNEHNRRSMEDRCTIVRYSILVSSRLGNDASTSSYIPSDDSDSASDDIVVLEECVRESEPRSSRESPRGSPNSTESSQGQEILEDPCYAERAETPPEVTASNTRGSASSTPGQATVTQADVGDSNNDSGVQDSFIEDGTPPVVERMERAGVATCSQTKRKCFCDAEVEALVYGVLKHGRGNWSVIKQLGGFHDRSSTDLSDKYRNLERSVERMSRLKDKVREQEREGKDPLQNWKRRNVQI